MTRFLVRAIPPDRLRGAGPRVQGARAANPGPRAGCRPSGKALCPPKGARFSPRIGLLGKGTGLVPLYISRANPLFGRERVHIDLLKGERA